MRAWRIPTELDRALGYEANYAGTSYITPDKIGKRIASEHCTFIGDRTSPASPRHRRLRRRWRQDHAVHHHRQRHLPQLPDHARTGAPVGDKESHGCCQADSWATVPFQRMPNVWLKAGPAETTLDSLISGIEDGVLIDGRGSYSIDQQRYNFQFGGDAFWEIKGGKKGGMISARRLSGTHPGLLAGLRRHRRPGLLAPVRHHRRRQRRAHANQLHQPRLLPHSLPPDQRTSSPTRKFHANQRRSSEARPEGCRLFHVPGMPGHRLRHRAGLHAVCEQRHHHRIAQNAAERLHFRDARRPDRLVAPSTIWTKPAEGCREKGRRTRRHRAAESGAAAAAGPAEVSLVNDFDPSRATRARRR